MTKNKFAGLNAQLLNLNLQEFGNKTLEELRMSKVSLGQYYAKLEAEMVALASNGATNEELEAKEKEVQNAQKRFEVVAAQYDKVEAETKAKFAQQRAGLAGIDDPKQKVETAKASLIRSTMRGKPIDTDIRAALGDDSSTGGGKFLPKTVSNDIIMEPLAKNPLRGHSAVTNIPNLELPKLSYTLDDDDFIADKETA